jgi:lysozyme
MNLFSANNVAIYWSGPTGAHEAYGAIRQYYVTAGGGPVGRLGLPTTAEYDVPGGRASTFQRGTLRWNAATGQVTG